MTTSFTLVDNDIYIYDGLKHYISPITSKDTYVYLNDSKTTKITYDAHGTERQLAAMGLPLNKPIDFNRWSEDQSIPMDDYWKALAAVESPREYILLQNILLWNYYNNSNSINNDNSLALIPFVIPNRLISDLSEANYQLIHRDKISIAEFEIEALSLWLSLGLVKNLDGYIYLLDVSH